MKYFFTLSFSLILAYFSKAQNPYPIVPIDSIQFVSSDRLATSGNTAPDYTTPIYKNLTYGDTIRVEGLVVTNPLVYGSTARKQAYIQRINGGHWSGVCIDVVATGTGMSLNQFIQETGFYDKFLLNKKVRVTGVLRELSGNTAISLIRNNINWSNSVEWVPSNDTIVTWNEISLQDLMQKKTAEKWEGAPVIIKNVKVNSVNNTLIGSNWSISDENNNVVSISTMSAHFRRDDREDTIPKVSNSFYAPPVGTRLEYIRGIIISVNDVYTIAPQYLSDFKICDTPCAYINISSPSCAFENSNLNINIKTNNIQSDTAYLEYSLQNNFSSLVKTDTIGINSDSSQQIVSFINLPSNQYFIRIRTKVQNKISNIHSIGVSENFSLNFLDTTIGFKKDSVILSGPLGSYSYLWSIGDSSRSISAKINGKLKLQVTNHYGCIKNDSTYVILIGGIKQYDTTLCIPASFNLSVDKKTYSFQESINNNISGWWPFNGNANDESGNGNHGLVMGATLQKDRFGDNNKSYYFNYNDEITTNLNSIYGSQPRTFSFWMKNQNKQRTISPIWYGGKDDSIYAGDRFNIVMNRNEQFEVSHEGVGITASWTYFLYPSIVGDNIWHHYVYVLDSLNNRFRDLRIYRDGELISQGNFIYEYIGSNFGATPSGNNLVNTRNFNPLRFGKSQGDGTQFSSQYRAPTEFLDDIGVWNNALSNEQVKGIYRGFVNGIKTQWSTNDTTPSITVFPAKDTTFYCTFTVGSYTFTDSVKVYVKGLPDKQVSFPKLGLCDKDTINLTAANGYNYQWYKESQMISNNRIIHVSEPGRYVVVLSDSIGCGNMSDAINIFKAPTLKTNFTVNDSAQCIQNNVFVFSDSTNLDSGNYNLSWLFEQNSTSNAFNPSYTYKSVGNKLVKLVGISNYGCKDSTVKMLTVNPNPNVGFMLGDSVGLETSKPYVYSVAQQLNHTYNWDVTNGIIVNGQGSNAATIQWFNNGKGKIKLNLTNPFGCSDSALKEVSIGSVGISDFNVSNSFSIVPNPNNGTFNISLNSFSNETINVNILNPIGQIVWTGKYNISNGDNIFTIKTSLPKGVYNLVVEGKDNKSTHKITIW